MIIQEVYARQVAMAPVMRLASDGAITNFPELVDAGAFRVRGLHVQGDVVGEAEAVVELENDRLEETGKEPVCDACGASVREWSKVGWMWFTLDGRDAYRWYRLCLPCAERCRVEENEKDGPPWVIQLKLFTPNCDADWAWHPFGPWPGESE